MQHSRFPKALLLCSLTALMSCSSSYFPAEDGVTECGYVSIFLKPPEAKEIYTVRFDKINGEHRIRDRNQVTLPVGQYTVEVIDHINLNDFSFNVRPTRAKEAKSIVIDVKANTSYYLGAEFFRDKKYKVYENEYWQPVVWKETDKACEL
ncbi:hypothetical protein [Thalassotalea sp. Y01]|uniref:hypothetical protein n=1 Tax=Thalassotalea sp. Y01 TaxID=2729613 RepID=UPI00145F750F|nr:hypothetical protein [Thalassotalea sp. Y01]NMP17806.1 hypothetical protein [Thalassotalea sp. Y01]